MEQIQHLPVPQLEPIQHLADYLDGLNACEALEGLNQLADRVLVPADDSYHHTTSYVSEARHTNNSDIRNNQQQQHLGSASQRAACFRFDYVEYDQARQLCDAVPMGHRLPMSPPSDLDSLASSRCSSAHNSSQWLSSNASSPAPSDLQHFGSSRSSTCSAWSVSSCSGPASVASSIGEQLADNCTIQEQLLPLAGSGSMSSRSSCKSSGSSRSSRSSSSSSSSSGSVSSSRRLRNATAAERYRRRQKGRKCGLADELELERERNEQLKREFEAKLTLYREFVALLARQTTESDQELASLGHRSLISVLQDICSTPQPDGPNETPIQRELYAYLSHFQSLLGSQSPPTTTSSSATQFDASLTANTCSLQSVIPRGYEQQQQQQQQQQAAAIVHPQLEQYCPRPGFYRPTGLVDAHSAGAGRHHQQLEFDFYADRFVPLIGA